ncbi:MAG: hypothetical protein VKJ64_14750 [Leptolyngbyaceae bacterium]|nr:hypothetical protein [Leptolyngbyaceae bacterium]
MIHPSPNPVESSLVFNQVVPSWLKRWISPSLLISLIALVRVGAVAIPLNTDEFKTTDVLQIGFATLGILSAIAYFHHQLQPPVSRPKAVPSGSFPQSVGTRKWLAGSGVLMGLGIACKLTTILLIPGLVMWVLGYAYLQHRSGLSWNG